MKQPSAKAILTLSVIAAVLIFLWILGGVVGFHTGRLPDEIYENDETSFYRTEHYSDWVREKPETLPTAGEMGFDLRSLDISDLSLEDRTRDLSLISFDEKTVWPEKLPEGFDPERILELGKDPGLNIRTLHEQGLTGKGVHIAIIDSNLNLSHREYPDNLKFYEILHAFGNDVGMHGAAVASIAVGKSCGMAPDAELLYISTTSGRFTLLGLVTDTTYIAKGIDRVLEINRLLPEDKKIRVISISLGYEKTLGQSSVAAAIERAKQAGVFVITTTPESSYDFRLMGLGRDPADDPNDVSSYKPGLLWEEDLYYNPDWYAPEKLLLVPMDARTFADSNDPEGYEFSARGGSSWAVPWLSGLYALCVQKDPDITPEIFLEKAFETGTIQRWEHNGTEYQLGTIIDPVALVESL